MFEFTESITIEAAPRAVWDYVQDVEEWWMPSNPDHINMEVISEGGALDLGTEVHFEERIAGIRGEASGAITGMEEGKRVTWEGNARYHYFGITMTVEEGVTWQIEPEHTATRLSAHVWAVFPSGLFGRLAEWYTTTLLDVIGKDRAHARRELVYLKQEIERTARSTQSDA